MKYDVMAGNPNLIMTLSKWLTYTMDPREIMFNVSAIDASDFHQPMPLGMAVFLTDAISADPNQFYAAARPRVHDGNYLANAIFSVDTTSWVGGTRIKAWEEVKRRESYIYVNCGTAANRNVSAAENIEWYKNTPFTISPRGNGFDSHRNYEAIIYGSVPIMVGADETMVRKYENLPVIFAESYDDEMMEPRELMKQHAEMLNTTYDFNPMTRSYWEERRPDIDILAQSVFWLKRFEKFDHVQRYFRPSDRATIDRINPPPYPDTVRPKDFWGGD